MLIYLKGISSAELGQVTDFLYNGETFITQEELKQFLETAQELQVKGLQGDLQGISENVPDKQEASCKNTNYAKEETLSNQDIVGQESILDSLEELADSFDTVVDTVQDGKHLAVATNHELDLQIQQMIEKSEGMWKCGNVTWHILTHYSGYRLTY